MTASSRAILRDPARTMPGTSAISARPDLTWHHDLRRPQGLLLPVLALDEPLARHGGTPAVRDFSQVSNRDIDGRTQVDGEVGFTRDLMVAQPDNLGTQRGTPESPHKNAGARLINR